MNENIKIFLQKLGENPELQEQLSACKTPDECYAFASSVQEGFTQEEFVTAMEQLKAVIESADGISEEDLAKIAGGIDWEDLALSAGAGAGVASFTAYVAVCI